MYEYPESEVFTNHLAEIFKALESARRYPQPGHAAYVAEKLRALKQALNELEVQCLDELGPSVLR
jgi:hypothetical protein